MIEIKNLKKSYGDKVVYDGLNLNINDGKITAILGASGVGKTTLLNILSGFIPPTEGEVRGINGKKSFIFQEDRLIKNLTVYENLKLVLKDIAFEEDLGKIGLKDAKNLYPKDLSAGMKRRVAVLRALLYPSDILFMDEPFINLDIGLKYSLINTVKDMQKKDGKTIITVTHDISEAVNIADYIIVIKDGKVIFSDIVKEKTEEKIIGLMMSENNF